MGAFIADKAVKKMIEAGQAPRNSKVIIFGMTFKENCPDTRNSKVYDIIKQLNTYGINPIVVDPWANEKDAINEYGIKLIKQKDVKDADCVIIAVAHNEFKALNLDDIKKFYKKSADKEKVLIDVKGIFKVEDLKKSELLWWRL
jgi:UDP-N-acetyl-D-galactosamine dehydrogenase